MQGIMIYSNEIKPGNVAEIIRRLYDLQFTDIFYIAKNIDGKVFYSSKIAEIGEDGLSLLCGIANKYKMGVYAWFCTFTEGYEGRLYGSGRSSFLQRNLECACVNKDGKNTIEKPVPCDQGLENYVCPVNPKVQEYELELMKEIVKGYPVKGIHLDFIRYPFPGDYCYCEVCCRQFYQDFGVSLKCEEAAKHVSDWRRNIITDFVNKSYREVKRLNKAVKLSALVWKYNDCLDKTQDWKQWDIDFTTPMFYHKGYRKKIKWVEQEIDRNSQISNKKVIAAVGGSYSNLFTRREWNLIEKAVDKSQSKGMMCGHYGLLDVIQTLEGRGRLSDIKKLMRWKYIICVTKGLRILSSITPNVIKQQLRARKRVNDNGR